MLSLEDPAGVTYQLHQLPAVRPNLIEEFAERLVSVGGTGLWTVDDPSRDSGVDDQ